MGNKMNLKNIVVPLPKKPRWWKVWRYKKYRKELACTLLFQSFLGYMEEVEIPHLKATAEIYRPLMELEDRSLPGKIVKIKINLEDKKNEKRIPISR